MGFLYVLKMYHVRLFIVEKMGFGMAPRRCRIRSKPQPLLQKTCLSYTSETLATYARKCLHTRAKGHFGHFISKNRFFLIQNVIFSILTLLKST